MALTQVVAAIHAAVIALYDRCSVMYVLHDREYVMMLEVPCWGDPLKSFGA